MQEELQYISNGRSGYVVYFDGEREARFFYEFGGGDCLAIIYIPLIKEWESQTGINVERRPEILSFIAQQVILDQAPNGKFKIQEHTITILKGE